MTKLLNIALALSSLVFVSAARAEGDLVALWRAAAEHNPDYAATLAQGEADQRKRGQAAALDSPQLLLGAGARYQTSERNVSGARFSSPAFGTQTGVDFDTRYADAVGLGWSLTLSHSLYDADRDAAARQLGTQAELGGVSIDAARQALMLHVAQAYFAVLAAEDGVAALTALEAAAREAMEQAHARYQAGDAPVTDQSDARARFDLITAQLVGARNELALRRGRLADLTGKSDFRLARPAVAAADPIGGAAAFEAWQRRAANNNPTVKRSRLQIDIADADVARLRAALSPTVDAYARIEGDRLSGSGYGADAVNTASDRVIGVQVNVPLWTGGMRGAKSQEAVLLKKKSQAALAAAEQEVNRALREAWLALVARRAEVAALEAALSSAQARLDANQTGFAVGERPAIDVLDAEQALQIVRRDLAAARYASFIARLDVYAAAGELDEAKLQEVNEALRD